ncbi:MAG: hypothetical protein JPMHGGIA_00597 [Saprospiraceae bacterium]|jgi:hypothetical protein|nr:hypothetical protein [Saprospiraceae bacterium]
MKLRDHRGVLPVALFAVALVAVCLWYGYHDLIFQPPQSIHQWRQSDGASLALNYYQHNLGFLRPHTHNLTSDQGTSSACAPSEWPLLYWSVSCFYDLLGPDDSIYRIFNTLLFLMGLFFLFRWVYSIVEDAVWSLSVTLLLFSSPVVAYYGNNYLSDSAALAFSFAGWYFFSQYLFRRGSKYWPVALFALSACLKPGALISPLIIAALLLYPLVVGRRGIDLSNPLHLRNSWPLLLVPLAPVPWIAYANWYNRVHDCSYFSTTVFPIWDYTLEEIADYLLHMVRLWGDQYFHPASLAILALAFAWVLWPGSKSGGIWRNACLWGVLGCTSYCMLQFQALADHDYYVLNLFVLPVLVMIAFLNSIRLHHPGIYSSSAIKVAVAGFVLFNLDHAAKSLDFRYNGWPNDRDANAAYASAISALRAEGVTEHDTIISLPDKSHASLYLLNCKGWTLYTDARFNRGDPIPYNQDSAGIRRSVDRGARYLFVLGQDYLETTGYLRSFTTRLVARDGEWFLFDLTDGPANFQLPQMEPTFVYHCDAENLAPDGVHFLDPVSGTAFEHANLRTDSLSKSGDYSVLLTNERPFGMTLRTPVAPGGERVRIEVWRKAGSCEEAIPIVAVPAKAVYENRARVIREEDGWQLLRLECRLDGAATGEVLELYLYNPGSGPAWFDDLSIFRYWSGEAGR